MKHCYTFTVRSDPVTPELILAFIQIHEGNTPFSLSGYECDLLGALLHTYTNLSDVSTLTAISRVTLTDLLYGRKSWNYPYAFLIVYAFGYPVKQYWKNPFCPQVVAQYPLWSRRIKRTSYSTYPYMQELLDEAHDQEKQKALEKSMQRERRKNRWQAHF